jgi:thymidylate synthase (FAD)
MKVELINFMGNDLTVVNAARVSFNVNKKTFIDTDAKLIKYLAKHKHMSPFGHCFASFKVQAPIFVARQLVKHKFLRWNEISRRYVNTKPNWYRPSISDFATAIWRSQTKNKKQGSGDVIQNEEKQSLATFTLSSVIADAMTAYEKLLSMGICEEQARMVLPICHMTEWFWSGSLDAFADMCILRCAEDAQVETKMVANQISDRMESLFPVSWKELMNETNS